MNEVPNKKTPKTSYRPYIIQGFIALFLLVFGIGGWAMLAPIKGAVIASGVVVVEGEPKTIQHFDGGIVGEILVKNGDRVSEGDVLVRLDPTAIDANRTIVQTRYFVALARTDQLKAARDGAPQIMWSDRLLAAQDRADVAEIMQGQENIFRARRNALAGQVGQLRQRIGQSEEQIRGYEQLIGSKQEQLRLISEELDGLRELLEKGFVSKTRVLALEREQARLNGEIATHRSDIARTRGLIGETEIQILQLRKDNEAVILTELREVESELSDLNEQLTTASDKRERIDVSAPVSGTVHDMSVTTIGGVISPGQPILQIIPADDRLVIEARVLPADIDQVYAGQDATIRLSAFNQRTTKELNGHVLLRSADSLLDQATGMQYFNVRLEIPENELSRLGELQLVPGMPAEAFLQTEDRTVWDYVMKPFTDQLNRAFRED